MTDDAFINPELELHLHQSNIETGPDYDAVQLQQSIDRTDGLLDSIQEDTESIVALEAMAEFIRGKEVNKTTAILFNVATEGFGNLSSLNAPKVAFALEGMREESDKLSPDEIEMAMENLAQGTAQLINRVSQGINNAMLAVGDIVHGFDKNLLTLKKRVAAFEAHLELIKDKDDVAYNYVKPENSFVHLLYTQNGFTRGIDPVMKDVNWLLTEHADMISNSVSKYKHWFNESKGDLMNSKVIDSLEFKRDDFVLPGSGIFARSVDNRVPTKGCAFYRSPELPGGKSFYSEVRVQNQYGNEAVDAMLDVKYFMDYYEPNSFKVTEKYLYNAASLTLLGWVSLMIANPLPLAMFGLSVGKVSDNTKIHDIKKARITPETVFPTLGKEQLKEVLRELSAAIANLEKWNRAVYHDVWKDKSIQEAMANVTRQAKESGHSETAVRSLRRYSVALITLMSGSYTKVHAYSFTVLNAALSYAEKSANQYR